MSKPILIGLGVLINLLVVSIPLLIKNETMLASHNLLFLLMVSVFCLSELVAGADLAPDIERNADWSFIPHVTGVCLLLVFWGALATSTTADTLPGLAAALAILVVSSGIALRYIAIKTLSDSFLSFIEVGAGQHLVRNGIYRFIRHPSELGLLLIAAGSTLLVGSLTGFLLFVATLLPLSVFRMYLEDKLLSSLFSSSFSTYKTATPALFPKFPKVMDRSSAQL